MAPISVIQLSGLWLALTSVFAAKPIQISNPYEIAIINDLANQRYNISIAVGTPPQTYNILFDTGSTDVWVPNVNSSGCAPNCPAGFGFIPSTSSSIVGPTEIYDARYGLTPDLAIRGNYYNDTISVGGLPPLINAPFAVGNLTTPFYTQGMRGIFGLGSRTQESIYNTSGRNLTKTYQPLWERLALRAPSGTRKYSIWLNSQDAKYGTVQFGGEDATKHEGRLKAVPLNVDENGDFGSWSVNLTSVTRSVRVNGQGKEVKTKLTPANYSLDYTVDSGSPNMYVPTTLYNAIVDGLGATEIINMAPYVPCSLRDLSSGYLDFEFATRSKGAPVSIRVRLDEIVYPPGYPVTLPAVPDRNGEKLCYFGIVPTDGEVRLLGADFMRSAYLVFDVDEKEIRMAQAKWEKS
jgi:hypothetical protein